MKRNIFKLLVSVLLLSLLVTSLVILTSCNDETGNNGDGGTTQDEATVSKIYIKDAEKPQTTFVLNAEPNFSTGKLTVEKSDSTTETIALNAEGVTVTGFKKDTLGEQTVTFTYEGKTTTLKVNVVRRMVFKSLNVKYFVGDVFDKSAGSIRLTTDDGKTVNVNMSDDKLSLEGFDSSKTGEQTVTVRYTDGSVSYTDTITVKVYDMGNMKLKTPGKLLYKSHDTELKISDGYLTVTASDDSTMTKMVPLTAEGVKITGFDPTKATPANVEDALEQIITVEYLGKTFTYKISITYSSVSIMRDAAEVLKELDWTAETLEITEEQGQLALEVMPLYFDMSTADRALLTKEELDAVLKVAASYGADYYKVLAAEFADAFELILRVDTNGNYVVTSSPTGKSYEAVEEAYDRLSNPEDEFILLGKLLTKIVGSFGKDIIYADVTIQQLILVMQEDWVEFTAQVLDHMIKLHKDLSTVPADWTVESLANHSSEVIAAVAHINGGYGNYINYVAAIAQVSSWRPNNQDDYLEIIYSYYLNYMEKSDLATLLRRGVPFPGELQDLYALIVSGSSLLQNFTSTSIWRDTYEYLMIYDQAMEISNKITSTEGLYKDIYNAAAILLNNGSVINFPTAISQFLSPAYYTFCNSLYGDSEFVNMYGVYMTIVKAVLADGSLEDHDVTKYETEYQDFINIFTSMSPAKQKGFLGTMHYLYHTAKVEEYMLLDYSKTERSVFIILLKNYMTARLSEEMVGGIAQDLWLAIEYYLNTDRYETALDSFMEKMAAVEKAYNAMTDEEKGKFDAVLGKVYTRYMAFYAFEKDKAEDENKINLGDYAALLEELRLTLGRTQVLLDMFSDETNGAANQQYLFLLFAAYEKSSDLVQQILASNNNYVLGTYYNTEFSLTDTVKATLDDAYIGYRIYFVNVLRGASFGVMDDKGMVTLYSSWNQYVTGKVADFFGEYSDLLFAFYLDKTTVSEEDLAKVKAAVAALEGNDFFLVRSLIGAELYSELVSAFSKGDVKAMADFVLAISKAHAKYLASANEEEAEQNLATYEAAVNAAAELAESLEENEEYKTYLKSLYDQFVLILESIQNSQVEEAA